jgi:hypothetical protein
MRMRMRMRRVWLDVSWFVEAMEWVCTFGDTLGTVTLVLSTGYVRLAKRVGMVVLRGSGNE